MFSSENIIFFFTFEICLVVFLELIDIYTDTKITKIGAFIAKLQAHSVFRAAILNFFSGKPRATIWFPPFLDSAYSKTPRRKFLCFYPEVHAKFTYPPHYDLIIYEKRLLTLFKIMSRKIAGLYTILV